MKLIWLGVAIAFAIGELLTPSLTLIWFSVGAIILIFMSKFIESIILQIFIFAVISTIMLVVATKKIVKKDENYKYDTNLQGIISKEGYVKEEILPNKSGLVIIGSEEWTAISYDNSRIEAGTNIKVIKIEGVKLVVKSKTN